MFINNGRNTDITEMRQEKEKGLDITIVALQTIF